MKILAIDSSGLVASAAILEDEMLIAEYTVGYKKTHSQTLLPMIDEIVRMTDTKLSSFDCLAVAGGPGSFTGLRIGSATAKGLGLALGIPIVSVPTLEGLAFNIYGYDGYICPMMDARRDQVYTGIYKRNRDGFKIIEDQKAVAVSEIIKSCNRLDGSVMFLGDGVPVYKAMIEESITVSHEYAPVGMNRQRAAAIGARAFILFNEGKLCTAAEHAPEYLRKSQAERERESRERE